MRFLIVVVASILSVQFCHSAPQRGGDPEDEVELVRAENTNIRDPESGFPVSGGKGVPVIIIRTSSGGRNPLHSILRNIFGNQGTSEDNNKENDYDDTKDKIPEIPLENFPDLSTILGLPKNAGDKEEDDEEGLFPSFPSIFSSSNGANECGLMCTLLKGFDTQLKQIEEEVREIRDREREKENEIDPQEESENEGPVNEYTEEVLPDGTIVRTNKTYHTSEDGHHFFSFQSTSYNSFGGSTENKPKEVEIEDKNGQVDEKEYLEYDIENDSEASPTNENEEVNEVREQLEENVGVDAGLFNA